MYYLFVLLFAVQTIATPTTVGDVIISEQDLQFPSLPEDLPSPIPVDENWEVLYYRVIPTTSSYLIRGELRNISPNPLETPILVLTFANDVKIDAPLEVASVGPGERAPFSLSVSDDDATIALNQDSEVMEFGTCENYGVIPALQLSWDFKDVEVEYDINRPAIRVTGTVTNYSGTPIERYVPTIFAFTDNGYFSGSIDASDFPSRLFDGDSATFDIDHGFSIFASSQPFEEAGRHPTFVVGMARHVNAYFSCA